MDTVSKKRNKILAVHTGQRRLDADPGSERPTLRKIKGTMSETLSTQMQTNYISGRPGAGGREKSCLCATLDKCRYEKRDPVCVGV